MIDRLVKAAALCAPLLFVQPVLAKEPPAAKAPATTEEMRGRMARVDRRPEDVPGTEMAAVLEQVQQADEGRGQSLTEARTAALGTRFPSGDRGRDG